MPRTVIDFFVNGLEGIDDLSYALGEFDQIVAILQGPELLISRRIGGTAGRMMSRWYQKAKRIVRRHVRALLGTDELYQLSSQYVAKKLQDPRFRRVRGKAYDQPLILTGELYDGIRVQRLPGGLQLDVDPTKGFDHETGFDYAEYWESGEGQGPAGAGFTGTHYLEKGLENAQEELSVLMENVLISELQLDWNLTWLSDTED